MRRRNNQLNINDFSDLIKSDKEGEEKKVDDSLRKMNESNENSKLKIPLPQNKNDLKNQKRGSLKVMGNITEKEKRSATHFEKFDLNTLDVGKEEEIEERDDTVEMDIDEIDKMIMDRDRSNVSFRRDSNIQQKSAIFNVDDPQLFEESILKKNDSNLSDISLSFTDTQNPDIKIPTKGFVINDESSSEYSFESDEELSNENKTEKNFKSTKNRILHKFGISMTREVPKLVEKEKEFKEMIKMNKGKMELNFFDLEQLCLEEKRSQIRKKVINPSLYDMVVSKFGKPTCISSDKALKLVFIGTEYARLVIYKLETLEMYEYKLSSESTPTVITYSDYENLIIVGTRSGDLEYIGYNKEHSKPKKLHIIKKALSNEILDIFPLENDKRNLLLTDSDNKLFFLKRNGNKFDKGKISIEEFYFLNQECIPRFDAVWISQFEIVAVSHAMSVTLFKYDKNKASLEQLDVIESPDDDIECAETFVVFCKTQPQSQFKQQAESSCYLMVSWGYTLSIFKITNTYKFLTYLTIDLAFSIDFACNFGNSYIILQDDNAKIHLLDMQNIQKKENKFRKTQSFFKRQITQVNNSPNDSNCSTVDNSFSSNQSNTGRYRSQSSINFRKKSYEDERKRGSDYLKELSNEFTYEEILLWEGGEKDIRSRGKFCYVSEGQVLYLTKTGLAIFERMTYSEFLQLLIKEKRFIYSLKAINDLTEDKLTMLRNLKNPMKDAEMLNDIVNYLQSIILQAIPIFSKREDKSRKQLLINYIMFTLAEFRLFRFMTGPLEQIISTSEMSKEYYKTLKIYYESRLLSKISKDKISSILNLYKDDDPNKIRFLLFIFNQKKHQEFVMSKSFEKRYYNLLLILCKDYDSESILLPIMIIQKEIALAQELEAKKQGFYKIFWIINHILNDSDFSSVWDQKKGKKIILKDENGESILTPLNHSWYCLQWLLDRNTVRFFFEKELLLFLEGIYFLINNNLLNKLREISEPLGANCQPVEIKGIGNASKLNPNILNFLEIIYEVIIENSSKDALNWNLTIYYLFLGINFLKKSTKDFLSDKFKKIIIKDLVINFEKISKDERIGVTNVSLNILIFTLFDDNKELFTEGDELFEIVKTKE